MAYAELFLNSMNENIKSNKELYKRELKLNWKEICNNYLFEFCNKHEYAYEPDCWIAGDPGTIVNIGDLFVSMEDIRYDIDNDIPEHYFENWYWKSLEVYEITEQNYINYKSYCEGCPDPWPESRLSSIRGAKQRVIDAQKALEEEINRCKNEN